MSDCKHKDTGMGYGYLPGCPGIGAYKYCNDCNETLEYDLDYSSCNEKEIQEYRNSKWSNVRLSELIRRLQGMQKDGIDPYVTIMQEDNVELANGNKIAIQLESNVKDLARSSDRVIIIGKELD